MTYLAMIAINLILGGQPYALTVAKVTPDLIAVCRLDENCMDINAVNDEGCTTDADCCAKHPELDHDLCGGGK